MVAFVVAALGGATASISDLVGVDTFPSLSGIGLAVALFGTGFGLVAWAKYVGFDEHVAEERPPLTLTDEDRAALRAQLDESNEELGRRGILTGLFGLSLAAMAVALARLAGQRRPQSHPLATRCAPYHR